MLLHDFALAGCLVVDATQVKHAMNDYASQLVGQWDSERLGVGGDGVERDDHIAADAARGAVVEGNDVGVVVVAEKLAVDADDVLVVAEDVGQPSRVLAVGRRDPLNPVAQFFGVDRDGSDSLKLDVYFSRHGVLPQKHTKLVNSPQTAVRNAKKNFSDRNGAGARNGLKGHNPTISAIFEPLRIENLPPSRVVARAKS